MNIELVGSSMHPSDTLRARIETKLEKLESRLGPNLFARVRLDREGKDNYACTVHFNTSGNDYTATATGPDLFKAADSSIAKLARQLQRHPRRILA